MTLREGSVFADRYEIGRLLASGGMGSVYEAVHLETRRKRALKVLHPQILQDRRAASRFRQEAQVAAAIESEFIVDVFDAGVDTATSMPFLVMELLKGEDLRTTLERRGALQPAEVVSLLSQAAVALDKAHGAGIVHRDIKPDNLFVHRRDLGAPIVKILDFGVAKVLLDAPQNHGETASVGTPLYMAPEQFKRGGASGRTIGPAADRYALAHVAYSLIVGEPYFAPEAETEQGIVGFALVVMDGATQDATVRARERRGLHLPEGLSPWFRRATALDPAERQGSCAELVEELARVFGVDSDGTLAGLGNGRGAGGDDAAVPLRSAPGHLDRTLGATQLDPRRSSTRRLLVAGGVAVAAGVAVAFAFGARATPPATSSPSAEGAIERAPASPAPEVLPARPAAAATASSALAEASAKAIAPGAAPTPSAPSASAPTAAAPTAAAPTAAAPAARTPPPAGPSSRPPPRPAAPARRPASAEDEYTRD